jgi:hypothetical protein
MSRPYEYEEAPYSSQQHLPSNAGDYAGYNQSYHDIPQTANQPSPYGDNYGVGNAGTNQPYAFGSYNQSQGYSAPVASTKKGTSKWIKFGIPIAIIVIAAAVVGGIFGSRESKTSPSVSASASSAAAASSIAASGDKILAVATNSQFMLPIYPTSTNAALYAAPTFNAAASQRAWPTETWTPAAAPAATNVRPDRPRIIAPSYKWQALPSLIAQDSYLQAWNDTIFGNATYWYSLPPVIYYYDGGNGILDIARQVKERIKAFSYVYRMTNDTKWVDRVFLELQNAAGNTSAPFGNATDRWNSAHFLDTAELTAAYGIAYDWLYDQWTATQKSQIIATMMEYGLSFGLQALTGDLDIGWWSVMIQGNWNCVCNNGLTIGALAILGDDTTGTAEKLLNLTIPNALGNCIWATSNDGTWSETFDYWYFGTTGLAEMTSTLITAAGSDFGLLNNNPNLNRSGLFHLYSTGIGSGFNYGDTGPNKYTATANSLMFWGDEYNIPQYQLFQRDQTDAADPWNMFWYNPTVQGAWWAGLAIDHYFQNSTDQWAAMRSSFADEDALFVGIKAGTLQNHQTHNDLDVGDFVIDALGTRWAGELGDGNYLSTGYFSNDTQDSDRWLYYRKRSEGQNVILVNAENQIVTAAPTAQFNTTGETQPAGVTVYTPPSTSTAYFIADIVSAYNETTSSYSRGIRMINGRKQVLLQDDINTGGEIMWRFHTNATVTTSGTTATLQIGDETMTLEILNPPPGASFGTMNATRLSTDPPLPPDQVDQPNPGVTVVTINLPAGSYSLQVLFNPQWPGMSSSDFQTPPNVPLSQWSLTSHNPS